MLECVRWSCRLAASFAALCVGPAHGAVQGSALEVVSVATGARETVYRAAGRMESPQFSPDGLSLYFNLNGHIRRFRIGATDAPALIDTGFASHCNNDHGISPDGTQLVVSDLTEVGKSLMYLVPIGGGTPRRIPVGAPAYWHGWSPDGRTLAYCAARNGNYDVYTIPVAGGVETRLTTQPGNDNGPDFSADGNWIYFHSVHGMAVQVWRMRPDGSSPEQLTHDDYFNWFPHPSPDGNWVAILSSQHTPETGHPPDGNYVLRLIPTAGGSPHEIARFFGGNGSLNVPCWSRDSTRIAFASFTPEAGRN